VGSRVHWIVVRDGQTVNRRLAGGAGMGLDYALGSGPEAAMSHWDDRGELDAAWWKDDVCDGGALIDADARHLLFFTVQPWTQQNRDVYAYRAAMLDGLARVWAGWRIEWAYDGIADLARYLGVDAALVRATTPAKLTDTDLAGQDPVALVTVGSTGYGLVADDSHPWWLGPHLLDLLTPERQISWSPMPRMGLHLEPEMRRAGLWSIEPICGIREAWARLWPGWELEFWTDRYVNQVNRSGFPLPPPRRDEALDDLAKRVEMYVPGDAAMRVMHTKLKAGLGSRVAVPAMEAAREAAAPAAAAAAALIRGR
jgi:hypothetical protein